MVAQTTLIPTIRTTEGAQGIRRVKCPTIMVGTDPLPLDSLTAGLGPSAGHMDAPSVGHPGRTEPEQPPVNPLDSGTPTCSTTRPPASNHCLL